MNFIDKMVERFLKLNRKMKRWQRAVSVMAAVVVFVTTYALVLPAITLDKDTATTQAGIEIAASENEADEAGTVFESEQEDAVAEEEPEEAEEPAAEEDKEEAVAEESSEEEDSSSESGSQDAEAVEAEADETEAAKAEAVDEADASKTEPAAEIEQTDAQTGEEAAANGTTEEATAAVTGQTAEEVKLITEDTRLTYEGSDYFVYADFGESAQLPEGVQLRVKEITKESDPEAYEVYYQKALSEMQDKYDENTKLSFAKFYDITFVYEGAEIEPSGNVTVRIEYKKAVEIEESTTVDTIHFDKNDDEKAEVIDSDTEGTEKQVEAVEFKSDQFSVYGVIGASLETEFTISNADGEDVTYLVKVTYGPEAKIPEGSTLRVTSIADGTEAYQNARNAVLADKKEKEEIVDINDFNLAALDISIIDPNGQEIEPEAAVTVEIKIKDLPGVENLDEVKETLEIQHHVEVSDGVVVEKVFDGSVEGSYKMDTDENIAKNGTAVDPNSVSEADFQTVTTGEDEAIDASFDTEVFSTFTITWRNNQRRVTVHYVDESGRNDITGAKVARDKKNIYFYVETADALTPPTGSHWMQLLIDADRDKSTGWNGYDFIVNRVSPKGGSAILEKNVQGIWMWEEAAKVKIYIKGRRLAIAIPRSCLGLDGEEVDIEFKWNDNMQREGDIMDFYVSGDTAPGGRFNYVYDTKGH